MSLNQSIEKQVKAFEQEILEQDPEFVRDAQERYQKQQAELNQPAIDEAELVEALKAGAEEAKKVRSKQLEKEIIKEYKIINDQLDLVMKFDKTVIGTAWNVLIKPHKGRIEHLEAQLEHWLHPSIKNMLGDDLERNKELALKYPITRILNIQAKKNLVKVKCPLHADKTPSFVIYPTNTYHCFGCNENGDAISLYRQLHQTNYQETIKILSNS